jgi:4-amino-4-deoxy-L-arabinose transferase-like glycosyltransferase
VKTINHISQVTPSPRYWPSLCGAILTAFVIRLGVVAFVYRDFLDPQRDHWKFGFELGMIAQSIVTGHGFANPYSVQTGPTAMITPVFPYLFAGIFAIFGIKTKAAALVILWLNSLFSALTCLPIFLMAKKTFGIRVASCAAWIWVFYPYAVYFSADSMWYHSFLCLLFTLVLLVALQMESGARIGTWAVFGVLVGLAALTTPVALGVLPFVLGWICYRLQKRARNWTVPLVVAIVALFATISPWLIRNYRTFNKPVFLKDNFWMEVCVGNVGNALHWWNGFVLPVRSAAEGAEFQRVGELAYMHEKRAQALSFIETHPGIYVLRCIRRVVFMWTGFWSFQPEYLREEPLDPVNIFVCTLVTLLALVGLRKAFREQPEVAVFYALVLGTFPIVFYLTHPELSFRQPIDPEIVILVSYAALSRRTPFEKTT